MAVIGSGFWVLSDFKELSFCGPCGPCFVMIYLNRGFTILVFSKCPNVYKVLKKNFSYKSKLL